MRDTCCSHLTKMRGSILQKLMLFNQTFCRQNQCCSAVMCYECSIKLFRGISRVNLNNKHGRPYGIKKKNRKCHNNFMCYHGWVLSNPSICRCVQRCRLTSQIILILNQENNHFLRIKLHILNESRSFQNNPISPTHRPATAKMKSKNQMHHLINLHASDWGHVARASLQQREARESLVAWPAHRCTNQAGETSYIS